VSLTPFYSAGLLIQVHATAAVLALVLGIAQFAGLKGTTVHRTVGWVWAGLMYVAAISSLFIHNEPWLGPFSPIHLLSVLVIFGLPSAILAARRGNVRAHKSGMMQLFGFGLIVAGDFAALSPGRLLYRMLFG
jgi:uncharacterized membrane protein